MILLLIYLLKVSASMAGLFMIYYLFLRHHTFHHANRVCLLLMIFFSFIVPLVSVSMPDPSVVPIVFGMNDYYGSVLNDTAEETQNQTARDAADFTSIVTGIYLLGIIFFSYRFFQSINTLYNLSGETAVEIRDRFRVIRTNLEGSFTFLNTIFLPKAEKDPLILKHEQAHVAQFHWVDLLVAEFASIILWFNPVMILVKRELRLQHEFLADRSVMQSGVSFEDYAKCLVKKMTTVITYKVTSPLFSSSNKKRILMMTKKKTSCYMVMAYLLMVPASAIMLMSFGRKQSVVEAHVVHPQNNISQNIPDIAPVDFAKVTKVLLYGNVIDPRTNKPKNHTGIDFALSAGSDVLATADGVVTVQQYNKRAGNFVRIKHDGMYSTRYYHLQTALVKIGEKVKKGQVIGLVGNTGLSTVPHLHYEILKNDAMVDPKDYLPKLPGS